MRIQMRQFFFPLDLIDELLEEGGWRAMKRKYRYRIHPTRCDWKQSVKPRATWNDLDDDEYWFSTYLLATIAPQFSITGGSPKM